MMTAWKQTAHNAPLTNFLPHFVPAGLPLLGESVVLAGSRQSELSWACAERPLSPDLPHSHQASCSGDCCTAPVMSSITAVIIPCALILQTKPGCQGSLSKPQCGVMRQSLEKRKAASTDLMRHFISMYSHEIIHMYKGLCGCICLYALVLVVVVLFLCLCVLLFL